MMAMRVDPERLAVWVEVGSYWSEAKAEAMKDAILTYGGPGAFAEIKKGLLKWTVHTLSDGTVDVNGYQYFFKEVCKQRGI